MGILTLQPINWACQLDCVRQQAAGNGTLKEAGAMTISRRAFLLIAGFVLLGGIIVALGWLTHPPKSDRQQIVKLLEHTERAIEQRDLSGLMKAISEDYDDGTYTKRELRRAALAGFREVRTIRITPVLRRLEVSDEEARADLDVEVWIDSDSPQPTMQVAMWVKLSKDSGRWLVTSAGGDWPNVPEQSFPYQ